MSTQYTNYINEHVTNVKRAYDWMEKKLPDIISKAKQSACDEGLQLDRIITEHDISKWSNEEYYAYDEYFYGNNKSYKCIDDFNKAWLHHIHNNPHHWQHWVLINDEEKEGIIVLDMPTYYIIEMICDWWSFSWKTGDLYEIFNWYEKRKDYIQLSESTRKIVEDILTKIRDILESEENSQNDFKK